MKMVSCINGQAVLPDSTLNRSNLFNLIRRRGFKPVGVVVRFCGGEVGCGVAGDAAGLQDTGFAKVVGHGAVHDAAVVPNHQLAQSPVVGIHPWRLTGEVEKLFQDGVRRVVVHAGNSKGVAPNTQRFASRDGVRAHQRTQRRALGVETVGGAGLDDVSDLGLAGVERMIGG